MKHGTLQLLGRIVRLGPAVWCDCARAVVELAWANRRLGSQTAHELLTLPPGGPGPSPASPSQAALVARVAFVIPRVGAYVPWRSDCLIQALAAQRWLASRAIAAEICIGVRRPPDQQLDAHAWLKAGDTLVTGGDITVYTPLYERSAAALPDTSARPGHGPPQADLPG